MKQVILIHRWGGDPQSDWYPWLKIQFERKGHDVIIPTMPNTEEPKIREWVDTLAQICPQPDENTIFIGHSIGCQAIVRYLEGLSENTKVDSVILVAPWTRLKPIIQEEEGAQETAGPWIETPINWDAIISKVRKVIALFSTDDQYVYLDEAPLFEEKLGAQTLIVKNRGHFTEEDGVMELPKIEEILFDKREILL